MFTKVLEHSLQKSGKYFSVHVPQTEFTLLHISVAVTLRNHLNTFLWHIFEILI